MSYYCERCELFVGASDAWADKHRGVGHSLLAVGFEAEPASPK